MPLKYGLVPNKLNTKNGDCVGLTTGNDSYSTKDIIEMMIERGSTVTKAEALAVIEEYSQVISTLVRGGASVNTELFAVSPSVSGNFTGMDDSFDPNRHSVKLNLTAGSRLQQEINHIQLKKVQIHSRIPVVRQFTDLYSGMKDNSFTPGQAASVKGSLLKFEETDPLQGIFLIGDGKKETRVDRVIKNVASELLFIMPDTLLDKEYRIEIRAKVYRTTQIRKGLYANKLVKDR